MNVSLKIFVVEDCPNCIEAREIAAQIEQDHPYLPIEIIDIANEPAAVPDSIFATPTFMLDGRIVSLGNPTPAEIRQWVEKVAVHIAS